MNWFKREGGRYEVACDVLNALIAHYAEPSASSARDDNPTKPLWHRPSRPKAHYIYCAIT